MARDTSSPATGWPKERSDGSTELRHRQHLGAERASVAENGRVHFVGGRFGAFEYNTEPHQATRDAWELRAALPTARCVSGGGIQSAVHETFTLS